MERLDELKAAIAQFATADGIQATPVEGMSLVRISHPSEPMHAVHHPSLCLVAQGRKRVIAGDRVLSYDGAHFLVVSVDTPVIGQVIEATAEAPYLCVKLDLDAAEIAALLIEAGGVSTAAVDAEPSVALSPVTPELLDAAIRLVRLLERPEDIAVMAPMIKREILFRLLRSDQATKLQQIALAESRLQQVNRAIGWIKLNYRDAFAIETVAAEARMSPSALHFHFKAVTAMSPLQYQKQLRLQEARRLMLSEALDAATAGHRVGYDSPSQFSREYARVFGAPPLRDVARLKTGDLLSAG
ncbi:MAG: AraC family transcriptional regulator [Devosia sp.]|uniref:AraC family transcriptional regulator n=1 Tax=Devosia sp. TaxID=1871048 RepID=UPI002632808B|nr:AraC family transcriptional regulator [Devosia sp.]MDB5538371.1 AraC family transcriptional regulator [Devosia sp.]